MRMGPKAGWTTGSGGLGVAQGTGLALGHVGGGQVDGSTAGCREAALDGEGLCMNGLEPLFQAYPAPTSFAPSNKRMTY